MSNNNNTSSSSSSQLDDNWKHEIQQMKRAQHIGHNKEKVTTQIQNMTNIRQETNQNTNTTTEQAHIKPEQQTTNSDTNKNDDLTAANKATAAASNSSSKLHFAPGATKKANRSKVLSVMEAAKVRPTEEQESDTLLGSEEFQDLQQGAKQIVIQKQPGTRTIAELQTLSHWISHFNSFLLKELEPAVLTKLCETVQYAHYKSQQTVFTQGEESDALYIIISGKVSIWINIRQESTEQEEEVYNTGEKINNLSQVSDSEQSDNESTHNTHSRQGSTHKPVIQPSHSKNKSSLPNALQYRKPHGLTAVQFVGLMIAGNEKCR